MFISFSVGGRDDLEKAAEEFDRLGISHGEIKDLGGLGILVMAFRDPDNIQLELTAPKGRFSAIRTEFINNLQLY